MIGFVQFFAHIIAVKGNVQLSILKITAFHLLFKLLCNSFRDINASWLNANKYRINQVRMVFKDLVTKPLYRNGQLLFSKDRLQGICVYNNVPISTK